MGFASVDDLLTKRMAGEARSPAAESLDMRLVKFARGVAVYEMPVRRQICSSVGTVENGVLTAFAETAMSAAALTTFADDQTRSAAITRELFARFDRPIAGDAAGTLRAEAIVVRAGDESIRIEAEVLYEDARVATFEATCSRATPSASSPSPLREPFPEAPQAA